MILLGATAVHAWHHRDLSPLTHECATDSPRDCTADDEACIYCHFTQPILLMIESPTFATAYVTLFALMLIVCSIRLAIRSVDRCSLSDPPSLHGYADGRTLISC